MGLPKGGIVALENRERPALAGVNSSVALSLAAAATTQGLWTVVLGWPTLGLVAAENLGVNLGRLVMAEVNSAEETLVALDILVGPIELIIVNNLDLSTREHKHLISRLRSKGTTLISLNTSWKRLPDVILRASVLEWQGLGRGHGYLQRRRIRVQSVGRRGASQERCVEIWMPAVGGNTKTAKGSRSARHGLRVV